jgi:hypothetical protein
LAKVADQREYTDCLRYQTGEESGVRSPAPSGLFKQENLGMKKRWLKALASLTLVGSLTCLGCGPSSTSVDPSQTQSEEDIMEEMQAQEEELMGDVNPAKSAKPAAAEPAEEEAPAEEKPTEE